VALAGWNCIAMRRAVWSLWIALVTFGTIGT
jgi:hypothetical protein